MPNPWHIIAVIVLCGAVGAGGYHRGYGAAEEDQALRVAEAQRKAFLAAEAQSRAEAARLALQAERDALALEMEDAARADPDASRPALGAAGVRRLNQR